MTGKMTPFGVKQRSYKSMESWCHECGKTGIPNRYAVEQNDGTVSYVIRCRFCNTVWGGSRE